MRGRYQNSVCKLGWLHKFRPMKQTKKGTLERCERCGKLLHCPMDMPNNLYVSYHVRDILRDYEPMYRKEYGKK